MACDGLEPACDALVSRLEQLLNRAGFPRSLAECGVPRSMVPTLAHEAAQQWTAGINPRKTEVNDFVRLYAAAFGPRPDGPSG